jgi:hypothetical protein
MASLRTTNRRLAVLLIAPQVTKRDSVITVGYAKPRLSDSESTDYVELLSAYNYPFDIIRVEDIHNHSFVDNGCLRYSSIVLAVSLSRLTASAFQLIRELSHDAGVSLIAAYDHPDERSAALFGIEQLGGKRILWPSRVKIIQWPQEVPRDTCVANYGFQSGLPGVRRRGLRKLSWKHTLTKALNVMSSVALPYVKSIVAPDACVLLTTMRDEPLGWSYQYGNARNYYFALHGDLFLDKYNELHLLVRSAIEANSGFGMVSTDLDKTMVLRLDDPGASQADYVDGGQVLNESDWNELGAVLEEKKTPLSVMYTPGWIDDGDARSGSLFVSDELITNRKVGAMYDSARVKYTPSDRNKGDHDHVSEFRGLKRLVDDNLVDVHSHGLTHLVPNYEAWAAAEDKNDTRWYIEFLDTKQNKPIDDKCQLNAMVRSKEAITSFFGAPPCVLSPSSHKHDLECDLRARDAGYKLLSSDYTAIIKNTIVIRNWKIPALFLFLKEPSASVFRAAYPIIGVVHDYEVKGRVNRFRDVVNKWSAAGIRRFISLNNLAAALCSSIDACYSEQESSTNIQIRLREAVRPSGPARASGTREIFLRVVPPGRLAVEKDRMTIDGAVLVSIEQLPQGTANLLIRATDTSSIKLTIPMRHVG